MDNAFRNNLTLSDEDEDDFLDGMVEAVAQERDSRDDSPASPTRSPSITVPKLRYVPESVPEVQKPAEGKTRHETQAETSVEPDEDEPMDDTEEVKEATLKASTRNGPSGAQRHEAWLASLSSSPRFKLSETDTVMLSHLDRVRYDSPANLATLVRKNQRAVKDRLEKLWSYGYVEKRLDVHRASVYFLSEVGQAAIFSENKLVDRNFGKQIVNHSLQINELMVAMMTGRPNEMSYMIPARMVVNQDTLVTEPEIRQSVEDKKFEVWQDTSTEEELLRKGAYARFAMANDAWLAMRKEKKRVMAAYRANPSGTAPEFDLWGEWLFGLYYGMGHLFHLPDLVMRGRVSNGAPNSVAIEIELTLKPRPKIKAIMGAYKKEFETPDGAFKRVVWIAKTQRIADALSAVRDEAGLNPEQCHVKLMGDFISKEQYGAAREKARKPKPASA